MSNTKAAKWTEIQTKGTDTVLVRVEAEELSRDYGVWGWFTVGGGCHGGDLDGFDSEDFHAWGQTEADEDAEPLARAAFLACEVATFVEVVTDDGIRTLWARGDASADVKGWPVLVPNAAARAVTDQDGRSDVVWGVVA